MFNRNEKCDDSLGMDGEPEQGSVDAAACSTGEITDIGQGTDIRKHADAPTARVSFRKKLGEMKASNTI